MTDAFLILVVVVVASLFVFFGTIYAVYKIGKTIEAWKGNNR